MDFNIIIKEYLNYNLIDLFLDHGFIDYNYRRISLLDNLCHIIYKYLNKNNIKNINITEYQVTQFMNIYEYETDSLIIEYIHLLEIEMIEYETFDNIINSNFKYNYLKCKTLKEKTKFIYKNKTVFSIIFTYFRDYNDHGLTSLDLIILINSYKLLNINSNKNKIKQIIKSLFNDYILIKQRNISNAKALGKVFNYINTKFINNKIPLNINNNKIILDELNMNNNKIIKIIKGLRKLKNIYNYNSKKIILWKIAEYYSKKKYSPDNILKYINLN